MYQLLFKKTAQKQFNNLVERDQKKVLQKLEILRRDPFQGKKLDGEWEGVYSMRAWPYRILYVIERKIVTVTVVNIGHRQGVYKR